MGGTAILPCKRGRWNSGSNTPPKWRNNRGEDVLLPGPEVDRVSRSQRKYFLYNDMRWSKIVGDCSLVLCNATWEDQGEYVCTYLEPEFKFVPFQNYWIAGHVTLKVTLMMKDLKPVEVSTVTKGVQKQYITVITPRVNNTQRIFVTLPSETIESVNTSTKARILAKKEMNVTTVKTSFVNVTPTPNTTFLKLKDVINVTQKPMLQMEFGENGSKEIHEIGEQMVEENDVDSSETVQNIIPDEKN